MPEPGSRERSGRETSLRPKAAAFELGTLPLEDALSLVYLYAEKRETKFERAALKYLRGTWTRPTRRWWTWPTWRGCLRSGARLQGGGGGRRPLSRLLLLFREIGVDVVEARAANALDVVVGGWLASPGDKSSRRLVPECEGIVTGEA